MSTNNVLRLEEYRDRRAHRRRLQASLCQADPGRAALLRHLDGLTGLLDLDRAAVVWVDEYGPGLVHPHAVLDLASDRPRRTFPLEPLRRAWESGIPGVYCTAQDGHGGHDRVPPWSLAVALGSDGSRAWFMVADSLAPRRPQPEGWSDQVMFLAGECSAVVLHRDLDEPRAMVEGKQERQSGFAGWPILKDIEGREEDDAESHLIALRFIVARLPRLLVEDDLTVPPERLREQASRAREEIQERMDRGPADEERLWSRVLDAFEEGDLDTLASRVMEMGTTAESGGHLHGAVELYRTAHEIAAAMGSVVAAVDSARFAGRVLRRMAEWSEAKRWYEVARGVAEAAGMEDRVAVTLDGMANVHRERGRFPAARATLMEAMAYAERSGNARALGSVLHGLMSVEHLAGNLEEALSYGWRAAATYDAHIDRVRALASLGGVLTDAGELQAAEDAWTVVSHMTPEHFYRLYAFDALSHIAALRGDEAGFRRHAAAADAMGWEHGTASAKAEILLYRGLSHAALGRPDGARPWLERAVAFAEEQGFNQVIFRAEEALKSLEEPPSTSEAVATSTPTRAEVRSGLSALKEEWVSAAS